MKKIAIDARMSGTSTGRYIDKLIEYLAEIKPAYKIIILTKKDRIDFMHSIAPKFEVVECPYKEFTFAEQTGFLKQLKSLKLNLIHFGMVQQPIFLRGKNVTTMHDLTTVRFRNTGKNWLVFTIKQWIYKWVNRIVPRTSEAIITPTQYVKDDVAKFAHINSRKITVTYEAADKINDAPELVEGLDEGDKFIMYVGQPFPHKNLGRLIQAFQILKQTHPELKLVLAGKKSVLYKQHQKDAERLEIPDVIFPGFISEGQLRWLYEHTGAYVFPSLSEGFGLPGLEAMVHGAPVVSSNATCLPEVYGDAAEYFDPLSIDEMVKAVSKVVYSKQLADTLRELGSKQANKYSWRHMADQTLEVYRSVLEIGA